MSEAYDPVKDSLFGRFFLLVLGLAIVGGLIYGVTNSSLFSSQAATVIGTTATTSLSSLEDGLVGHWTFDGDAISGTTVTDVSGNGNNGTLTNGSTPTAGIAGQGMSFDGSNDYVSLPDIAGLDAQASFTLSGWFKPVAVPGVGSKAYILSKRGGGFLDWDINIDNNASGGKLRFNLYNGGNENVLNAMSTTVPLSGQWYHVAAVYVRGSSSSVARIYVNGVLEATATSANFSNYYTPTINIGSDAGGASPFNGAIDEVRGYDRVFSADEVYRLYTSGKPNEINSAKVTDDPLTKGLVGYWKLDEGSGTTAADSSGNGNTGTLTGGPTWTTGKIEGSTNFDGTDDHIEIGSSVKVGDSDRGTIAGWVKFDSWNVAANNGSPIFSYGGASKANAGKFTFGQVIDTNHYISLTQTTDSEGVEDQVRGTTPLSLSTWYHMVAVSNGSSYKLYLNGKEESVVVVAGSNTGDWLSDTIVTEPDKSVIGRRYSNGAFSSSWTVDGLLDEVRIYNRALSADEVAALYRTTAPTDVDTSLVGHWTFDGSDISGTTAYDRSGKGNNGTLTNGPVVTAGKVGQGMSFDGSNDQVAAGSATNLDDIFSGGGTVIAWVKARAWSGGPEDILRKDGSASGFSLVHTGPPNTGYTQVRFTNVFSTTNGQWRSPSNIFTTEEWFHVVVTYDNSSVSNDPIIYIDGTAVTLSEFTTPSGTAVSDASANFIIGNASDSSLDDVRIYDRILSAEEVQQLYAKSAGPKAGLCGTGPVTDANGNKYGIVQIGTQCWLDRNMNVGTRINGATNQTNNATIEKWCYSDTASNCTDNHPKFPDGGLYQWNEAMQYSTTEGAQGICPSGWHIPTDAEWYVLESYLKDEGQTCDPNRNGTNDCAPAGTKLKAGGTTRFEANLSGYYVPGVGYSLRDSWGPYWSSSGNTSLAWSHTVSSGSSGVARVWSGGVQGRSVRCIKD